jgi:hypothetical protein
MVLKTKSSLIICFLILCQAILPCTVNAQSIFYKSRLTPQNYFYKYRPMHKAFKNNLKNTPHNPITALEKACNCNDLENKKELCLYNKFLFTDFIIYFAQEKKYKRTVPYSTDSLALLLSQTRDYYYNLWLSELNYSTRFNFQEHYSKNLKNISINDYQKKRSSQFPCTHFISKMLNKAPNKNSEKEHKKARYKVYTLLDTKTPFNSIFTLEAFKIAQDSSIQSGLFCIKEQLKDTIEINILQELKICLNNDSIKHKEILGILSSQRHYLIRDLKSWMEQNMSESEFNKVFEVFKTSSLLYFKMQTYGLNNCAENYPDNLIDEKSCINKPYHFWATYYIANHLRANDFSQQIIEKEALYYSNKYKRKILIPGIAYNLWFRNNIKSGTVGDFRKILLIQKKATEK